MPDRFEACVGAVRDHSALAIPPRGQYAGRIHEAHQTLEKWMVRRSRVDPFAIFFMPRVRPRARPVR